MEHLQWRNMLVSGKRGMSTVSEVIARVGGFDRFEKYYDPNPYHHTIDGTGIFTYIYHKDQVNAVV